MPSSSCWPDGQRVDEAGLAQLGFKIRELLIDSESNSWNSGSQQKEEALPAPFALVGLGSAGIG
jgi:hypothetical protein